MNSPAKKSLYRRVASLVAVPLILAPVAFAFYYVRRFGVDVPLNDTWTMVVLFESLAAGNLTVGELFAQHNEHRIFFPRIAMLAIGVATAFDNVAILYAILGCMCLTLATLFFAFRRSVGAGIVFFIPAPFLVFSLGQYWNMVQAFQITLVFSQMFGVLSLYLLYLSESGKERRFAFPGAVASAIVASFSAAPGLPVWPAGLLLLLILPLAWRTKRNLSVAWGVSGLVAGAVYFIGFESPPEHTSSRYMFEDPAMSAEFFLTMLGSSLFWEQNVAFGAGVLLLFLTSSALLFMLENGKVGESAFWISLIPFSLATLAATTVARGGSGLENALNEKYVTYSILAVVATYMMLVKAAKHTRTPVAVFSLAAVVVVLALSLPPSYSRGMERGEDTRARIRGSGAKKPPPSSPTTSRSPTRRSASSETISTRVPRPPENAPKPSKASDTASSARRKGRPKPLADTAHSGSRIPKRGVWLVIGYWLRVIGYWQELKTKNQQPGAKRPTPKPTTTRRGAGR